MSSSTDFSAAQLDLGRAAAWHQNGAPIATGEAAREFIERFGLVQFSPAAKPLGAPAPTLVEATLGEKRDSTTAAEADLARQFVARLTAEGSVVPLSLLGSAASGATPDFVASAKVFSYIFTLRGDKAWKQAPSTTGASKVSPLGLSVFESLTAHGAQTAAELASDLGREVTETAILRALQELWSLLRVVPQLQMDGGATRWELATQRFAKTIKAGANAGVPSALSALLSLYLSQSLGASEEEIAAFLSPLVARSRVREVVHALIAARQLEAVVVDGKTMLHVSGDVPAFAPVPVAEGEAAAAPEAAEGEAPEYKPKKVGTGRISRLEAGGAVKESFRGKPAFPRAGANKSFGARKPAFGARGAAAPDRERRPFVRKDGADAPGTFARPWDEDKRPRRTAAAAEGSPAEGAGERKPYERKPYERKPYAPRDGKPFTPGAERKSFAPRGDKPYAARGERKSFGDGERKPFAPRGDKPFGERKSFAPRGDKPFGERKSFAPRGDKPFAPRGDKPFGERKSFAPRGDKPFAPRGDKPFGERKPFAPRGDKPFGERKSFAPRGDKPFGARAPRAFKPREEGDRPSRPRREPEADSGADYKSIGSRRLKPSTDAAPSERPVFRKFDARPDAAPRAPRPAGKSFGAKPAGAGGFAKRPAGGAKFGAKSFGAKKSGGPFAKRAAAPRPKRKREE